MDLGVLLTNNHTNTACTTIITQNVSNYLNNQDTISAAKIAPDATNMLINARKEQQQLGWGQWIKGRISSKW
jgi:hypothetical protein